VIDFGGEGKKGGKGTFIRELPLRSGGRQRRKREEEGHISVVDVGGKKLFSCRSGGILKGKKKGKKGDISIFQVCPKEKITKRKKGKKKHRPGKKEVEWRST